MVVERPASGLGFERAIDAVGHRAHLLPQFNLKGVSVSRDNVLGSLGGGLALTAACFTGAAALVGIFAVALMRSANLGDLRLPCAHRKARRRSPHH